MLFTSYSFLGFAAGLLVLYYLIPARFQWKLLLLASYAFYFLAGPSYPLYIAGTTLTVWYTARRMDDDAAARGAYLKAHKDLSREEKKAYRAAGKKVRARWLTVCLLANLGVLAVVKYTNFAIANLNALRALWGGAPLSFWTIALPMGISFYTFMAIGYLVDVYRGTVPAERNLFKLALFLCYFPHLVQGPISRFGTCPKRCTRNTPSTGKPSAGDCSGSCGGTSRNWWWRTDC